MGGVLKRCGSTRGRIAAVVLLVSAALCTLPNAWASTVRDPGFEQQWNLPLIGAPAAWEHGTGEGITVAIIDTGIDLDHEDLASKIVASVSCIGAAGSSDACRPGEGQDDHGHGTHVAGIAAAAKGNGRGIAGVARDAGVMAVRVLEADGTGGARGSAADVRAGIAWAVDHGADVINLSLSENVIISGLLGSSLRDAVNDAWKQGVITVAAAGNTGNQQALFGSGYEDVPVVVVTATDRSDRQASYAANVEDAEWGIAAPGGATAEEGEGILST